jgi:hypothetical protein
MFILCCIIFFIAQGYSQNNNERISTYTLPDVLKSITGHAVETVLQWETTRRPEILNLFEDNVYGEMPESFDSITFKITNDVADVMDAKHT